MSVTQSAFSRSVHASMNDLSHVMVFFLFLFLAARILGKVRRFICRLRVCMLLLLLLLLFFGGGNFFLHFFIYVEISPPALILLSTPGSVHSGPAS